MSLAANDTELFVRYREGDRAALDELVRLHSDGLYRFVFRRFKDGSLSEDVVQETWLNVMRGKESYSPHRPFKPWLYTIALNRARRMRPKGQGHSGNGQSSAALSAADAPGAALAQKELADRARKLVDGLPEEQREVVLMAEMDGLSYPEIADLLKQPVGTVKSQMHWALKKIRAGLEEIL